MANYNPHGPYIIGEEWVPILAPGLVPNDITERGYTTVIDHTAVVVSGAYYVKTSPPTTTAQVGEIIAVYPAGMENETGPIQQVVIPVDAVIATGSFVGGNPSVTASALQDSSDFDYISIAPDPAAANQRFGISFDVSSYSQQLFGKRILNVEFLYTATGVPSDLADTNVIVARASAITNGQVFYGELTGSTLITNNTQVNSISFGELNIFHSSTVVAPGVPLEPWAYPWRYPELALFDASATPLNQKLIVVIQNQGNVSDIFLGYAALRVTYCEEQRVAYGASRITSDPPSSFSEGHHMVPLKTPAFAVSATLAPGSYSIVTSHVPLGVDPTPFPPVHAALEELYSLPSLLGLQVNKSLTVDDTFTAEYVDVLPALTLHTAAAVVTGSHPYGTQIQIPVYDTITGDQDVSMRPAGASASYPQVRFYARRFGDTTQPLVLVDVATGLSTVSITVAEFDALPEIVNGWREVTLRFTTAPTFVNGAGDVNFRWQSTSELAGSQWQVLGQSMMPPLPTGAQIITPASYFAPDGTAVDLIWKSPAVSGVASDTTSDAVIIFSQDPPTVSGFAVTQSTQEVAAVGLNCGTPDGCIPTGVGFNSIAWTPIDTATLPATGFGYYELERYDSTDNFWSSIMTATSPYVSGFADYEARVGQLSIYQMRVRNVLDFAGAWVSGSGTIPAPGVDITGDGNSVLIFTSNVGPTGNLAYTMVWENRPIESFIFPEADAVTLQRMYGKNFMTAFRPLERGGERFRRVILVNSAAIALPSLANFRGLRDLAWADLPYVCVRDELGNRWYATVIVPSGDVQVDRQLYLAQIEVVETSETPFAIDPA
jgi:hypothetical protein